MIKKIESYFPQILLLSITLILIIFLSIYSPNFMQWDNWKSILDHGSVQLLLAIGMTFVIASGGIDLSVGSIMSLTGLLMAIFLQSSMDPMLAIPLGIILGLMMGMLNGIIIQTIKLAPFIVTLATASLFRGLGLIISQGQTYYGFPEGFIFIGKSTGNLIPYSILIAFIVLFIAWFLMRKTKWGQYSMAIGSNEKALKRMGVWVSGYKVSIYMFSGLMAVFATIITMGRLNTAEPNAGLGIELDAITAVIMGGTLMGGGKASIIGTGIACLLLSIIKNGLVLLSIPAYYQQFLIGLLLIISVIITALRHRKKVY